MKHVDPGKLDASGRTSIFRCGGILAPDDPETVASAGQCDRMCSECARTCTRDWGHTGPHRCDTHWRG